MPFCDTCGLSMSETAGFCPTCGTRAAGGTSAGIAARPSWASPEEATPPDDWSAPSAPAAPPAAKPSVLHRNTTGLAIAAGVVLLVIVLVAVFMHGVVSGTGSEKYTQNEANQLQTGSSLAQVEALLGPPTSQMKESDGAMLYEWDNKDHSFVAARFANGAVISKTYNDYLVHLLRSNRFALGVWGMRAVLAAFTTAVFGACLFFATRMFGYSITVTQVVIFAVVTGLVTLVPMIGWLLALVVGASLIERWSSAGWWASLLIILVAGFIAAGVNVAVFGLGSGLGLAL